MTCPWCANPEGMPMEGAMIREEGKSPRLSCKAYETEEILREAVSCVPMFFDGGGVTFSGGEATCQFEVLKELSGPNVTFELLKYHEYGRKKWEECGWTYAMDEKAHVTVEQMKDFQEKIRGRGLT